MVDSSCTTRCAHWHAGPCERSTARWGVSSPLSSLWSLSTLLRGCTAATRLLIPRFSLELAPLAIAALVAVLSLISFSPPWTNWSSYLRNIVRILPADTARLLTALVFAPIRPLTLRAVALTLLAATSVATWAVSSTM
jgi:hypothetical protein